jgi:hypothetical protein
MRHCNVLLDLLICNISRFVRFQRIDSKIICNVLYATDAPTLNARRGSSRITMRDEP